MKSIGGYFEYEVNDGIEYHRDAIKLNTARNALEYILKAKGYSKIYIPYFTCEVLLEPIEKLGLKFEFYHIDQKLEPLFDYNLIGDKDAFLYTNYFGLKDSFIRELPVKARNIIIDNAQSFYSLPLDGIDTFYSPRKFFGVTDGAYLYTDTLLKEVFGKDTSYQRFEHILRRTDVSPEDGYPFFLSAEKSLNRMPILEMSNLTSRILGSIDYKGDAAKRRENYYYLHSALKKNNKTEFQLDVNEAPMVYPFLSDKEGLREKLISNRIYVAKYWPNVLEWTDSDILEYHLTQHLILLPIDKRITKEDIERMVSIINSLYEQE